MKIASSILELIGNTPLVHLTRMEKVYDSGAYLIAKTESTNPGGSIKDRTAMHMIERAEKDGVLQAGGTLIEPTSGNTGVGLAMIGAMKGYRVILTMPEGMSVERQRLVQAYGAEVVLTPAEEGMKGAIDRAERLQQEIAGAIILQQFANAANSEIHYLTTGQEIWNDTDGRVDIFVAGIGTGGTLSGVGRKLKRLNPHIQIVGVEPASSPVLSEGRAGQHKLQGIGAGFVPPLLDRSVVDEIIAVGDDEALTMGRRLAREEGILAGISAGAALCAAIEVARRPENRHKLVVVLLPDTGERYLSTELFEP